MLKTKISLFIIFALIIGLTGTTGVFIAVNMSKQSKVIKQELIFNLKGETKEYDGIPLELSSISLDDPNSLPKDYSYSFNCSDTITNVGTIYPNPSIIIYDNQGNNVTGYYDCIIQDNGGGLTVTPKPLDIEYNSATKTYDGTPLKETTYKLVNDTSLVSGQNISVNYKSEANTVEDGKVKIKAEANVFDLNGINVTNNYRISDNLSGSNCPTFSISGYKVTIRTNDATKTYDGKVLSNKKVTEQGLREDDEIVVLNSTEIIDVSQSGTINTITKEDIDIINVNGESVKDMYEIEFRNEGILTINPYVITLSIVKDEPIARVSYNGEPQSFAVTDDYIESLGLLTEEDLAVLGNSYLAGEGSAEYVDAGKYPVKLSIKLQNGDEDKNFQLSPGYKDKLYFEITPSIVNITLNPIIAVFDNKEHKYKASDQSCWSYEGFIKIGHMLNFEYDSTAKRTLVGETIVEASATITDISGQDVSKNYNVVITRGLIKVTPRDVTVGLVDPNNNSLVYTNSELFPINEYYQCIDNNGNEFNYELSYKDNVKLIKVGKYYTENIIDISLANTSISLTNFNFIIDSDEFIEIKKREVHIEKIADDEDLIKKYTGESLFDANEVFGVDKETGDPFEYTLSFEKEYVNIGVYKNVHNNLEILIDGGIVNNDYFIFTIDEANLAIEDDIVKIGFALVDDVVYSKPYDGVKVKASDVFKLDEESQNYLSRNNYRCVFEFKADYVNAGQYNIYDFSEDVDVEFYNNYGTELDTILLKDDYGIVDNVSISIAEREVTLITGSASKVYDGKKLVCRDFQVTGLPSGFVALIDEYSLVTAIEANQYDNMFDIYIYYGTDDVTDNFNIDYQYGLLTIEKATLLVTVESSTVEYGTFSNISSIPLNYSVNGSGANYPEITIEIDRTQIELDAGEYSLSATINYGSLTETSFITSISEDAKLIITKKKITLQSETLAKEYDGYAIERVNTINGFNVTYSNNYINAGVYQNIFTIDNNLLDNYDVTYIYGTLTITKVKVTLTSPDLSKEYDGYEFERVSSISGYQIVYLSEPIDAGTYSNAFEVEDADSLSNYEFTYNYGILTISKKKIIVITNSFTIDLTHAEYYDDDNVSITVVGTDLLSKTDFSIIELNTDEELGTFANIVYLNDSNYDVTYNYGTITYI